MSSSVNRTTRHASVKPELAGYRLLEPLGRGAGSVIRKAVHEETGQIVAVKHIVARTKEDEKHFVHVEHEYKTLRLLNEAAGDGPMCGRFTVARELVRSRKLLARQKFRALVMDYVAGADMRREKRYPLGQMVDFFLQVAEVLEFLHGHGVVHADLKPENMIVDRSGRVTVVDFGLSCPLGSKATTIRGTREYMAPEQVDLGWIDGRTDLYNLGASFYYLLSERQVVTLMPDANGGEHVIVSRKLKTAPLDELCPQAPRGVSRVVMSCVERDPALRPRSARELLKVLRPLALHLRDAE